MTDHQALPVEGYKPQSQSSVDLVNYNKLTEERVLRLIDSLAAMCDADPKSINGRWLNIARTHIEQGFMAMNRAVFQPTRAKLPDDTN
jgi:hypothetical protein